MAGLGVDAAVCGARLRARLCDDRPAGLCRAAAKPVAQLAGQRFSDVFDPLHRRRDFRAGAGVLSLRLHAGARCLSGAGARADGGGAHSGSQPMACVLAGCTANGAAGDRRWCRAGSDGDAGGFRRGLGIQLRHLHHRYLQDLVRVLQPADSHPAGQSAAAVRSAGALCRAPGAG